MAVDPQPISPVPPGVTPDYVNPRAINDWVITTSWTLSAISMTVRLMVKWRVIKGWTYDDCEL